jgi:hypothetical protein
MSALDEIKEGFGWEAVGTDAIRIIADFPNRPDNWLLSWSDTWRVQHEDGKGEDFTFPTEKDACNYLWGRLMEPLLPPAS